MDRVKIDTLPNFTYNTKAVPLHTSANFAGLLTYLAALAGGSLLANRRVRQERMITTA